MPSISEVLDYEKKKVGSSTDHDGWYGAQCVDLIMDLYHRWFNFTGFGNALDYMTNAMPPGSKRYKKGETQPQVGDILIWKWGDWDIYGHIGFCTAYDGTSITSVEQNVDGGPIEKGGPARYRTRPDTFLVGIIRLPYSDASNPAQELKDHNFSRVPEIGKFTSTIDSPIYIRRAPSTSAEYAKDTDGNPVWYEKGQSVIYDSYVIINGYVWISYIGGSGNRNYIATGEWNGHRRSSTWGTFSEA